MNQLEKIFNYHSKEVRVVFINDQPWFVATDICKILEIANPTQALQRLDIDERSMFNIGRQGEVNVINEAGLYSLILTSRKPEAKAFKRWITHEVLPSIRTTGQYIVPQQHFKLPSTYKEALIALVTEIEEKEKLQLIVTEQQPKVELYDTLMSAEGCQNMSQVAKSLGWGRNRLYAFLRDEGVLIDSDSPYKRNLPHQQYINQGYFKVIDVPVRSSTGVSLSQQTLVTPKGVDFIARLIKQKEFELSYIKGIQEMKKVGVIL